MSSVCACARLRVSVRVCVRVSVCVFRSASGVPVEHECMRTLRGVQLITHPLLGDRERTSTTFRRCVPRGNAGVLTVPDRLGRRRQQNSLRHGVRPLHRKKILVLTSSMRGERGLCHQHSRSMCVRQTLEQPRRGGEDALNVICLLYTSPSPRDRG